MPALCVDEPKWRPCTRTARLAGTETIHQVDVHFSGDWGPYARCDGESGACRHEGCPSSCPPVQASEWQECIACGRARVLPGVSLLAQRYPKPTGTQCKRTDSKFADCERPWEVWKYTLAQHMSSGVGGGFFLSLPKAGECDHGQVPTQKGCSWSVAQVGKAVSLQCLRERIIKSVEVWGAECFKSCGSASSRRNDVCYIRCFFNTIVGNSSSTGVPPLQPSWIVHEWQQAFANPAQGGCPGV